ncbi:MAG: hypothetical protein ACLS9K_05605 [Lachnospira eligens]
MDCLVNLTVQVLTRLKSSMKDTQLTDYMVLESCDLNVFAIRRAMWQMDNAGWLRM